MSSFLAIIPARYGSKRLPNKNILELNKKPLIAWTIEAAKNSDFIEDVCVTSDDDRILSIAGEYNVIKVKRPLELASDTSTTFDAIKHAIESNAQKYEYIVLLQPTSPLRTAQHINAAIDFLKQKSADAVISVCEIEHSPLWSNVLPSDLDMSNFLTKESEQRSQELPKYFRLNGAIYICKTERLLAERSFFIFSNIYAFIMKQEDSIDIDTILDFHLAEILLRQKK